MSDDDLRQAVMEMNEGLIDADLGGGVFKKRIGSHSHGKRGGSRELGATNLGDRWFFVFGFAKNERSDLSARELRALKALAADLLQYSDQELQKAHISKVLKEITYGNH
ncbi:type II toxin-antitoxin system RelE/ParE family toxin [Marinobacter shengliensis]|uniref:type II toxin-antitoxin system RelE/ParE family toxin n=1 Tax=Marinobacter shengliensis TaxID=1389223 RepID=UPI002572C4A1|nr:type II toxin-antitoxin system RelE/ParE family toxin [Marinobacter shengliensis]